MRLRQLAGAALVAGLLGCQASAPAPSAVAASSVPVAPAAPTSPSAPAYDAPRITPAEVAERQKAGESFVIVDVRGAEAYQAAHIEGAVHHTWASLQQADPGFPRDKYILLYCT